MIKTTSILIQELSGYRNPLSKINRMVSQGRYFSIIKGLYETSAETPAHYLAASIYGPSYISFEYALSFYSLIPETVYACTSATFQKRKLKRHETPFGLFTYRDVPNEVFPYGIDIHEENGYVFLMAAPEKAVCDELYKISPVANQKELEQLLFEDLRIDSADFAKLNISNMIELAAKYHSTNLNLLSAYLKGKSK